MLSTVTNPIKLSNITISDFITNHNFDIAKIKASIKSSFAPFLKQLKYPVIKTELLELATNALKSELNCTAYSQVEIDKKIQSFPIIKIINGLKSHKHYLDEEELLSNLISSISYMEAKLSIKSDIMITDKLMRISLQTLKGNNLELFHLERGKFFHFNKKYDHAANLFSSAMAYDFNSISAIFEIIKDTLMSGSYEVAKTYYDRMISIIDVRVQLDKNNPKLYLSNDRERPLTNTDILNKYKCEYKEVEAYAKSQSK